MFEDAEKNGKQAMMFLGTRVTGEAYFEDYARFCMLYYGDEYEEMMREEDTDYEPLVFTRIENLKNNNKETN